MSELDGATIEVIRSYVGSTADEMRRTPIRTAVVYEVLDFGITIYDWNQDHIAASPGLAFFLGADDYAIRKEAAYVGVENLEPGDITTMNYPYWSAAHAMDVTLFARRWYGRPSERDPARMSADVLEGYVTREAARNIHKVAVTDDGGVGVGERARLRQNRAASEPPP